MPGMIRSCIGYSGPTGREGVSGDGLTSQELRRKKLRKERLEKLKKLDMSETDRQIELLKKLAEMEKKVVSKDDAISFLQRAGILDEKGEISDNYPNWKKYNEQ
jgi:hypothetical protein